MGLAVLPARLKGEMARLKQAILEGADLRADEATAKHADWVEEFTPKYQKIDASISGATRIKITGKDHRGGFSVTCTPD